MPTVPGGVRDRKGGDEDQEISIAAATQLSTQIQQFVHAWGLTTCVRPCSCSNTFSGQTCAQTPVASHDS
jgi:hypothetical protein